jgi:hypothetical protein
MNFLLARRRRIYDMSAMSDMDSTTRQGASDRISGMLYATRTFNKQSKQRFARARTSDLMASLGRAPTYPEKILISRIIAVEWDLRRIDAKMDRGEELSGDMMRARLAAENRLRLDLRELGLRPVQPIRRRIFDDLLVDREVA